MPEHFRALIVILALAAVVFAFAKAPACAMATAAGDFERRRNLWIAITLTGFLAHNFWIFIVVTAALLCFALPREPNKLAMFFFLLFALPTIPGEIPALGIVNFLITIHYVRLLALVVLLPAFLSLRKQPDIEPIGRPFPDRILLCYIFLSFLLSLQHLTFTEAVRINVVYAFTDIFLPYYVASRSLRNLQAFREALMGFLVAALVLSAIGAFEFAKSWLLYSSLNDALGTDRGSADYLGRGGSLRALGTTGQSIALGYAIAVAAGFFLYLRKLVPYPMTRGLGLVLLTVGLICALSRGPWVGAATMLVIFIAMGPAPGTNFARLGLTGLAILPVMLLSPWGEKIIDYLPFVGTVDAENVTFRERLLELSVQVILQNPVFGIATPYMAPELQELRQGSGLLDVVNTYLGIGMSYGLFGLALFVGFFIVVCGGIFKGMRNAADRTDEHYLLGRMLFSTLLGIMIIIFTVSSITIIPTIYWSVAGLGVGYMRILALTKAAGAVRPAGVRQTAAAQPR